MSFVIAKSSNRISENCPLSQNSLLGVSGKQPGQMPEGNGLRSGMGGENTQYNDNAE